MPSFGASDYIHLRQESSSATLTSFLEPSSSTSSTGQPPNTVAYDDQVSNSADVNNYVASDDEVAFRDGVVLDFRPCQNKWTIFSRRNNLEKVLMALVGILFLSVALLVIVYVSKATSDGKIDRNASSKEGYPDKNDAVAKTADGTEVCISAGCVAAAAGFIEAIDFTKDPCVDFSDYACGKWIQNNPIPDDLSSYSKFTEVRERVKKQMRTILESKHLSSKSKSVEMVIYNYNRCMDTKILNEDKTKYLLKALEDLGGWPYLKSSWSEKSFDLTKLMGQLSKDYGLDMFLSLSVYANPKNTTENILTIDQGTLSLGDNSRDYYLNDTLYHKEIKAYRDYLVGHINYLAKDMGLIIDANETLANDIDNMMEFERKLANITVPDEDRRNQSLLYNKWTLGQLDKSMEAIEWQKYFEAFVPDEVYNKFFKDNPNYVIIVTQPTYMDQLNDLLKSSDKKVLINYVIWRFIKSYSNTMDVRFDDLAQEILKVFSGREQKPLRWKICVPRAIDALDLAAGALYAHEHFKEEDKVEAKNMVANLKDAFKGLVHDLDWMDLETKKVATEKADTMLTNVGYADFIMNDTKLDDYYKRLKYENSTPYFEMNRILNMWEEEKSFLELLKPFDRHKFEISPAVVNAFYSPEKNSINFPAGILQPPFFKGDFLKAINYGAIGAVIGHEITHGFDDQGSQFDKDGNLDDWWSSTALEKFQTKTKCIIAQYSEYSLPGIEQKVNGKLTQGENIADNGGVKEAFKAYKKFIANRGSSEPRLPGLNFTNEQVFFLSYAQFWCGNKKRSSLISQILTDPHSPEVFRINGVLTNSNDFAAAFQCKPGTKMNPKDRKKCVVW